MNNIETNMFLKHVRVSVGNFGLPAHEAFMSRFAAFFPHSFNA